MPADRHRERLLERYGQQFEQLKAELGELGYILQGSLTERWMECGQLACRCHADPQARHGPYYQWSWKSRGKTGSVYLDKQQATVCRNWVGNNRRLERILKRMRALSVRVARHYKIARK